MHRKIWSEPNRAKDPIQQLTALRMGQEGALLK